MSGFKSIPPYYLPKEFSQKDVQDYLKGQYAKEQAELSFQEKIKSVQNELHRFLRDFVDGVSRLNYKDVPIFVVDSYSDNRYPLRQLLDKFNEFSVRKKRISPEEVLKIIKDTVDAYKQNHVPNDIPEAIELKQKFEFVVSRAQMKGTLLEDAIKPYIEQLVKIQDTITSLSQRCKETERLLTALQPQERSRELLTEALINALTSVRIEASRAQQSQIKDLCDKLLSIIKTGKDLFFEKVVKEYTPFLEGEEAQRMIFAITNIFVAHTENIKLVESKAYIEEINKRINGATSIPGVKRVHFEPEDKNNEDVSETFKSTPFTIKNNFELTEELMFSQPGEPDSDNSVQIPSEQEKFEEKKARVLSVIQEYIDYNRVHCQFSIFHRHGSEGRNRAINLRNSINDLPHENIKDLENLVKAHIRKTDGGGGTNDHSLRTMLYREMHMPENATLQAASEDLKRLPETLDYTTSSRTQ